MGQIGIEKKMELIRRVRMEQHHNRNVISSRENLLYGKTKPPAAKSEIYGLEASATAGMASDNSDALAGNMLKSFKIRLIIAVSVFAVYVFVDQTGMSFMGLDAAKIHGWVNEGFEGLSGYIADLL